MLQPRSEFYWSNNHFKIWKSLFPTSLPSKTFLCFFLLPAFVRKSLFVAPQAAANAQSLFPLAWSWPHCCLCSSFSLRERERERERERRKNLSDSFDIPISSQGRERKTCLHLFSLDLFLKTTPRISKSLKNHLLKKVWEEIEFKLEDCSELLSKDRHCSLIVKILGA